MFEISPSSAVITMSCISVWRSNGFRRKHGLGLGKVVSKVKEGAWQWLCHIHGCDVLDAWSVQLINFVFMLK